MRRLVYVDVSDSRGLTALHFATYKVHIDVVNVLLDFGANVNQLSDDGLTPLALAFLLYYGNNPEETINTALEHTDPIILNPRASDLTETNSMTLSKQNVTSSSSDFTSISSIMDETKFSSSLEFMKLSESERKSKKIIEICSCIIDKKFIKILMDMK